VLLGVCVGAVPIPLGSAAGSLAQHLLGLPTHADSVIDDQIVWSLRFPRVLLALLAGAALSVAGAVLQTVIRNPLADPYVIGISSGASLAAVSVIVLGPASGLLQAFGVPGAAFLGAVATLLAVLLLSRNRGRMDPQRLILAGVAVAYLAQAGTSVIQLVSAPDKLQSVIFWLLGSVASARWSDLPVVALALLLTVPVLLVRRRHLDALLMGDDFAAALGVNVSRLRAVLLIASSLLTAVVVSVAGGIGFVGLIVPHLVRLLVGAGHQRTLPLTIVIGACFLTLADTIGRTVAAPLEIPLSIVTAVIGVPVFLTVLLRPRQAAS